MRTGRHHSELKPDVCWQLPLRSEDEEQEDGTVVTTFTEFGRQGWGDGGSEFAWWCTEAPEAFTAAEPVYRSMAEEMRKMLGDELYKQVVQYLDERTRAKPPPAPHPSEVPVRFTRRRSDARSANGARRH
jgi:hypothetical protein